MFTILTSNGFSADEEDFLTIIIVFFNRCQYDAIASFVCKTYNQIATDKLMCNYILILRDQIGYQSKVSSDAVVFVTFYFWW